MFFILTKTRVWFCYYSKQSKRLLSNGVSTTLATQSYNIYILQITILYIETKYSLDRALIFVSLPQRLLLVNCHHKQFTLFIFGVHILTVYKFYGLKKIQEGHIYKIILGLSGSAKQRGINCFFINSLACYTKTDGYVVEQSWPLNFILLHVYFEFPTVHITQ